MPRVSVIIPCYNRETLLAATLDSVLAQTFEDWEAIVVDDHSQDNSLALAQNYSRKDSRIRPFKRQRDRKGGNICRNEGISLATGAYIIFLDSDDLLSANCLERRVADMDRAPDCGFGVYQTELFTRSVGDRRVLWNAYTVSSDLHRFLSLDTVWLVVGPIWRKQALAGLGGFDENVISFQDWELHVRALIAGIKYFKKPVRDNFYRFKYDVLNAVTSVKDTDPDHLESAERLFERTFYDLRQAGCLDNEIRSRVAGMFWWLTNTVWKARRDRRPAEKVWRRAASLGLCSRRQYIEGCIILRLHSINGGQRLVRVIQRFWPPQYTQHCSQHMFNTPIGCTDPKDTFSGRPQLSANLHPIHAKAT